MLGFSRLLLSVSGRFLNLVHVWGERGTFYGALPLHELRTEGCENSASLQAYKSPKNRSYKDVSFTAALSWKVWGWGPRLYKALMCMRFPFISKHILRKAMLGGVQWTWDNFLGMISQL